MRNNEQMAIKKKKQKKKSGCREECRKRKTPDDFITSKYGL